MVNHLIIEQYMSNDAFFVSKPPTMSQPPDSMLRPEGEGVAVGGTIIGGVGVSPTRGSGNAKRKNGERGKDGQKRSLRRCKLCVQHKSVMMMLSSVQAPKQLVLVMEEWMVHL